MGSGRGYVVQLCCVVRKCMFLFIFLCVSVFGYVGMSEGIDQVFHFILSSWYV